MPLKNWCSIHARWSKSSLKHSIRFCDIFPSLKHIFIAFRSSTESDCIFEIHQLWQSGFSRVYSNCCFSCSFGLEIIKIGQSSHKTYSKNILNFQESTTNLNAHTIKIGILSYAPRIFLIFLNEKWAIWIVQQHTWRNGCRRWFPEVLRKQSSEGFRFNPHYRQVTIQEYLTLVPGYTESEQEIPVVSIKDVIRSFVKVPEFDKHLKRARGHIARNVVEITITIKMKTIVRKTLMIKINKLRLRNVDN